MLRSFAGDVFGVRFGNGVPWAVALHGWGRDRSDFEALAATSGIDVVALDLPGFGASGPPGVPWGTPEYAEAVLPALAELAAAAGGPLVLLGHSFGGRVSLHLAVEHPEVVGALVLTGVPLLARRGPRPKSPPAFRLLRRAHRLGLVGDKAMERARSRYGSADYRRAEGVMRPTFVRVVNENYAEALTALRCPVEMVWGDRDDAVPPDVAERAAAMVQGARLEILEGIGHMVPLEAPDALARALERARLRMQGEERR